MLLDYAQHLKPRDRRAALAPAFSLLMHGTVLALLILWMPRAGRVTPPKLISVELVETAAQPDGTQQNSAPQPVTEILPSLSPAPPVTVHLQPLPLPAAPLAARTEKTTNEISPASAETPAAVSEKSATSAALAPISSPSEGVFDPGRPLSRQEPVYPEQAARHGLEGMVELRFTILADGRPDDIRVVKSEPAGIFDEAALRSQRTARYTPATRDGVAVDQPNCRVIFHFQASR